MTLNGTEAVSHAANELGDGTPAPERAQTINNQQNPATKPERTQSNAAKNADCR